jgi:hypothetical protein
VAVMFFRLSCKTNTLLTNHPCPLTHHCTNTADTQILVSLQVTLTAVDGSGLNLHTLADDFNRWCFMVPAPGRYRVAPYVSADDRAKGLVVAPTHSDVSLVGEPVTDLSFGQAKLNFHGSVLCLDGACPDDLMVVVHVASTGTKILSGKVGNIPPDDPATVTGVFLQTCAEMQGGSSSSNNNSSSRHRGQLGFGVWSRGQILLSADGRQMQSASGWRDAAAVWTCSLPVCFSACVCCLFVSRPCPYHTEGGRGYSFHRVRPGNYLVSAVREGWCWEGSSLPASVGQTDSIAPDLKHKGYELQVSVRGNAANIHKLVLTCLSVTQPGGALPLRWLLDICGACVYLHQPCVHHSSTVSCTAFCRSCCVAYCCCSCFCFCTG